VFAFDLDGQQKREIILPYDALNKSLGNSSCDFKYLQIMVCGEYVLLQYNCYTEWLASTTSKGIRAMRRRIIYRLKPLGFSIILEYVRKLPYDDYDGTLIADSTFGKKQRGATKNYYADLRRDKNRICLCDGVNNFALYRDVRMESGLILVYTALISGDTVMSLLLTDKIPFVIRKDMTKFASGDFHLLLGNSFLAFSKFHLNMSNRDGAIVYQYKENMIFILKTTSPVLCGDKPKWNIDHHLKFHLRIVGDNYVFLDSDDQLVAWPRKQRGRSPPVAKVFI
jgi:hypothetical protein